MIRLLENEETKDIRLYDTVSYAGYDWYVIGLDSGSVTLLVKDNDVFGRCIFDKKSNDYKTSNIRNYLNSTFLSKLESKGANPLPVRLPDVGCTDKVWLLSVDEAEKLPRDIRKFSRVWWLRSRGRRDRNAACVLTFGDVDVYGISVNNDLLAVRPAIKVMLEELQK